MACSRLKITLTFTTTVSQSYSATSPWSSGKTKSPHAVVNAFVYAPNVPVSNIGPEIDCPHCGITWLSSCSPCQLCDNALNQSTPTYRGVEALLYTFLRTFSVQLTVPVELPEINSPEWTLDRSLVVLHGGSGHYGEVTNVCPCLESNPWPFCSGHCTAWAAPGS
jgi:hypothetical protein